MIYVDSHIHLYDDKYVEIIDNILEEAIENNVKYILSVSEDFNTSVKNLSLNKYNVLIGLGIHPWTAIYKSEDIERTIELIYNNISHLSAIGEVGLDKKYNESVKYWDREVEAFKKMIYLAKEFNKTLNIHSRKAAKEVIKILYSQDVDRAYLHWFTDDIDILKEAIDMGYYIGFTPSALYSKRIQKMIAITPLERILTETDGPVSFYGELKNELTRPVHVKLVLNKISEIKDIEHEEVSKVILDNFKKLFIAEK